MTSKISLIKLMREDLRHRGWMIALSALVQVLAGPVVLMILVSSQKDSYSKYEVPGQGIVNTYRDVVEYLAEVLPMEATLIAMVGALIVAIWGFRHLYSKRMTDLIHSMPVTREKQFLAMYLNGLLIYLVPFLLSLLIMLPVALSSVPSRMQFDTALLYRNLVPGQGAGVILRCFASAIPYGILTFLLTYHLCLVAISLAGTVFNSLVNIVLLGLDFIVTYGVLLLLADVNLVGFIEPGLDAYDVIWLSPLAMPWVWVIDAMERGDHLLYGDHLPVAHPGMVIGGAAMMVFLFVLAWVLYKKRPSEQAESGMPYRKVGTVLVVLNSVLAGILGGMFFSGILGTVAMGWCIFGMVLGCVLAFGILEIVRERSFKAFFGRKALMAGTLAGTLLLYFAFYFDWFGFAGAVPSQANIQTMEIQLSQYGEADYNAYRITFDENGGSTLNYDYDLAEIRSVLVADPADRQAILSSGAAWAKYASRSRRNPSPTSYDLNMLGSVTVRVDRKFGLPFYRRYQITEDALDALRHIVESPEFMERVYPASSGMLPLPESVEVETAGGDEHEITDPALVAKLMETYYEEFREHYCLEELGSGVRTASLELSYPDAVDPLFRENTICLELMSTYGRTLDILRQEFPEEIWKGEDLADTTYIGILSLPVGVELAQEDLYSYFGVEGYPDWEQVQAEKLGFGDAGDQANVVGSTYSYNDEGVTYSYEDYTVEAAYEDWLLEVTDPDKVLPYLQIGNYYSRSYQGNGGPEPVSFGRYVSKDQYETAESLWALTFNDYGSRLGTIFVLKGSMPKEVVEDIRVLGNTDTLLWQE